MKYKKSKFSKDIDIDYDDLKEFNYMGLAYDDVLKEIGCDRNTIQNILKELVIN
ncbi:hypothetical protein [Clostridiisalibacter paucivorans]|uniref:hypothetical protein n=1 Tax=Clostridiisalibacter paucivorans TaxID=408753 RepID=UPI0012EB29FD|nr:hypothetical protein [Clostridiisalibacter paucivorans]